MYYYKLEIETGNDVMIYNKITDLLKLVPVEEKKATNYRFATWRFEVKESDRDKPYDFINSFLDMLEPNFLELQNIGITKSEISFWLFYEYEQQCSMEFNPQAMKRLGENEITLCISCWQK